MVKDSDKETVGDTSNCVVLALACDCCPPSISGSHVALNVERRCAEGVERSLSIVLDADVELVITDRHQCVLELVHSITHFGEDDCLKSTSRNLHESNAEDIIHVILQVAKHVANIYQVALLNANNCVLVVN